VELDKNRCALALLLMAVAPARADKIVLKNGRKILAYNVVEVGDENPIRDDRRGS
jgi:hypothetical protein